MQTKYQLKIKSNENFVVTVEKGWNGIRNKTTNEWYADGQFSDITEYLLVIKKSCRKLF